MPSPVDAATERLDDWIAEDNPVRAVDGFVDELNLAKLGFEGAEPRDGPTGLSPGHVAEIYIYGYLTAYRRADGWSARASATSN